MFFMKDVVRGKRDHLGVHNTGNVVLQTSKHGDGFIVIDGQQRITTAMLLLAALRQVLLLVTGGSGGVIWGIIRSVITS